MRSSLQYRKLYSHPSKKDSRLVHLAHRKSKIIADSVDDVRTGGGSPNSETELSLSFNLTIDLNLDRQHETDAYVHVYLSNHVTRHYHEIGLGKAASMTTLNAAAVARDVSRFELPLRDLSFDIVDDHLSRNLADPPTPGNASKDPFRHVWLSSYLNIDVFSMIKNAYGERCPQRAGCFRVCVAKLMYLLAARDAREAGPRTICGQVSMPHVFPEQYRIKGNYTISHSGRYGLPNVMFGGQPIATSRMPTAQESANASALKNRTREAALARSQTYIDACRYMFDRIPPTWESVLRHDSNEYLSRNGLLPPLAYALDPTPTHITEQYYRNAIEIVMGRNRYARESMLQSLERFGQSKATADDLSSISIAASHMLCLYVVHCIYRRDFVYVPARAKDGSIRYVEIDTEDFGDVEVDSGASDCEDFTKNIARHHRRFTDEKRQFADPLLVGLQRFLRSYFPAMVLLGVSSAEINAAPATASKLGAHENAFLIPKHMFFDIAARLHRVEFENWREQLWEELRDIDERANWERSKVCPVLVLEGTGFLHPISSAEPNADLRMALEEYMSNEAYYALRRTHYYQAGKDSNFIKSVQKMFFPDMMRMGFRFGSFLVCSYNPSNVERSITRGVRFADFTEKRYDDMVFLMEPEFTLEEKVAIRHLMRDLHPVPFQDAPLAPEVSYSDEDRLVREQLEPALSRAREASRAWISKTADLSTASSTARTKLMTYYLRKSECRPEIVNCLVQFFAQDLPVGSVQNYQIIPEKVTDQIGGYRIELSLYVPAVLEQSV